MTNPVYIAPHVYFRITNRTIEKERFLRSAASQPHFRYNARLDEVTLLKQRDDMPVNTTIAQRNNIDLVVLGATIQKDASPEHIDAFRRHNMSIFGEPRRDYATAILSRIRRNVNADTQTLWDEASQMIGESLDQTEIFEPSKEVFLMYRQYLMEYIGNVSLESKGLPLFEILKRLVEKNQLDKQGWQVKQRNDASHARVSQKNKTVYIGANYVVRHPGAGVPIAVHEIYGHALRGSQLSIAESEGFAIVLEQLMENDFTIRRSYRYLAAALGWGTFGKPMTFRQVFEILWRVMAITRYPDHVISRRHAFDECARVFRGGRPDIPGAVYLKDSIYFSANIMMWETLEKHRLSYNEFVDVIEGRRKVLI